MEAVREVERAAEEAGVGASLVAEEAGVVEGVVEEEAEEVEQAAINPPNTMAPACPAICSKKLRA